MRRLVVIGLLLVFVLSTYVAALGEKVTLRLGIVDPRKTPQDQMEEIIKPFRDAHPELNVELANFYGENINKLMVEMVAGVAADVYITYNNGTVLSMRNGFNLDLSPLIQRDNFQSTVKDFLPPTLNLLTMNGHLYGFPQYQSTGAMYYNPQYFADSGLPSPNGSWDWDEFARITQKLTRTESDKVTRYGMSQYGGWLWMFPWLVQSGVDFSDPYAVPLNSQAAIKAIDYVADLMKRGYANLGGAGAFFTGQSASFHSGSWELSAAIKAKMLIGVTAPPKGPARQATLANTDIVSINKNTKYPDQAWEFVKWFYSREAQRTYMQKFGLQPARLSMGIQWVQATQQLFRTGGAPDPENLTAFVTNSVFAMPQPFFADAKVITEDLVPAITKALKGEEASATALLKATELATQKLKASASK